MHRSLRLLRAAILTSIAAAALSLEATSAAPVVAADATARAVASCPDLSQGLGQVRLSMDTPTIGWLLVECGVARLRLYRTGDGWRSWVALPPFGGGPGWTLAPLSTTPGVAIILMSDGGDGARGTQWRLTRVTTAGRVTTFRLRLPVSEGVLSMSFANARDGAILATRGGGAGSWLADFLVTTDGGRTWALRDSHLSDVATLLVTGPKSAYVAGETPVEGQLILDHTRTAGRSWTPVKLPLPAVARTSEISVASLRVQAGEVQVVVDLFPRRGAVVAVYALGPSGTRRLGTFRNPGMTPLAFLAGAIMYEHGSRIVRVEAGHWTRIAAGVQIFVVRGGTMWAVLVRGPSIAVQRVWP